jgi:lambda family phage portal protein
MRVSWFDRFLISLAPMWGARRLQARRAADMLVRHYEAATPGRRTQGWARSSADADVAAHVAITELRMHSRDLLRNNGWAKRARALIANNTVGWGLRANPVGGDAAVAELWKKWAESTACDSGERQTFYGIQHLAMKALVSDGEVLIRRRWRRPEDGLPIPLTLQVLEADFLDTQKNQLRGQEGGAIVQGVEFDAIGRRVAYWLFPEHPGSGRNTATSRRVSAYDVLHVFDADRGGQTRGLSWLGAAIVNLKDLDEFEDADLMRQKIAASFAGFVTDPQGAGTAIGEEDDEDEVIEHFEPGTVQYLRPGEQITFPSLPTAGDGSGATRALRRIAAGLGVTYEDMTGDYSQVNFSSARMGRLTHWANVEHWRWNMLVPQLCQPVWNWAMEGIYGPGVAALKAPGAEWVGPGMPMIEPDKEGLALNRLVRAGAMTFDEMVRAQGNDPERHWAAYAANLKRLDALGIKLDSDVRAVSQAGLTQERVGGGGGGGGPPKLPSGE